MIKNIVFDMGNVLFDFKPSEYIRRLGYTGRDAELLETEVFKTAEWCAMDRGTLKPAQVAQILAQRVPEHLKAAVEPLICRWWEGDLMPTPGIGDLIQELKAGGYGTGSYEIAKTLQDAGCDYLAVAVQDEGVDLRKAGIVMPIIVLNPSVVNYKSIFKHHLEPEVYSIEECRSLIKEGAKYSAHDFPVHIKIDTGMHPPSSNC